MRPDEANVSTPLRERALELLELLLSSVESAPDVAFRARSLTQIAEMLWNFKPERARQLLEEAFASIRGAGPSISQGIPSHYLHLEVLQTAARKDPSLAEQLIASIPDKAPSGSQKASRAVCVGSVEAMPRADLYAQVASTLAEADPALAAKFVKESLSQGLSGWLPVTLRSLRVRDTSLADGLFLQALSRADTNRPGSEAELLLLGSYVFPGNPGFEGFSIGGPGNSSVGISIQFDQAAARPASPEVIQRFLDFAYQRLAASLAAQPSTNAAIEESFGLDFSRYATGRLLLPLFQAHVPEKAVVLDEKLQAFRAALEAQAGVPLDPMTDWLQPPANPQELIMKAEKFAHSDIRDGYLMRAAAHLAQQGDLDQARAVAERLSQLEFRDAFKMQSLTQTALKAIEAGDSEKAEQAVQDIKEPLARANLLGQLAGRLEVRKEKSRALAMLHDALQWLERAPEGEPRLLTMLELVSKLTRLDPTHSFALMRTAIDAVNREAQTQGAAKPDQGLADQPVRQFPVQAVQHYLRESFPGLASIDFEQALILAQSIQHAQSSWTAQIAVCRAALTPARAEPTQPKASESSRKPR